MRYHLINVVGKELLFEKEMSPEQLEDFSAQDLMNEVWKEQTENRGDWCAASVREAMINKLIKQGFKQVPYIKHHVG